MCTNDAVNRLEYYIDDLVDCFEDYVKQSLMIITVAVGAILLLLSYLLKLHLERSSSESLDGCLSPAEDRRGTTRRASGSNLEPRSLKNVSSDNLCQLKKNPRKATCSATALADKKTIDAPVQMSALPSMDERFLKEVGYSNCSKSCSASKRAPVRNSSMPRITVPSRIPTCLPKDHESPPRMCSEMGAPNKSCCSMCCADDKR